MHWLLIGYMFLFIHRPFEVWPWLGELHVERAYMILTFVVWLIWPGKRWLPNTQHWAYAAFAAVVVVAWLVSPWAERGQPVVEDYLKIGAFYFLLVTTVSDERGLKRMLVGFLAVMALYLTHSFREYLGGRHTFRMSITRMIGVDTTLGDPNSFGASIVYALPLLPLLWRLGFGGTLGKCVLIGYFGLSVLCLLLTGSRSSLLGLFVWMALLTFSIRKGWMVAMGLLALSPVVFLALPESLQTRFETIVNPNVGTDIERQSGEGRIQGLLTGLELWAANPVSGVGPGAWRPATGSSIESHNLYGQLAGELGTPGLLAFAAMIACFGVNIRDVNQLQPAGLSREVARAVAVSVLLLLVMGCFGHNLFRFTWLWYGGFLIVARHVAATQGADEEIAEPIPTEWTWHSPHRVTPRPTWA